MQQEKKTGRYLETKLVYVLLHSPQSPYSPEFILADYCLQSLPKSYIVKTLSNETRI